MRARNKTIIYQEDIYCLLKDNIYFVDIYKNGSTILKEISILLNNIEIEDGIEFDQQDDLSKFYIAHHTLNATNSKYCLPVKDGKPKDSICFAVWRDPVDRFISLYRMALDKIINSSWTKIYYDVKSCQELIDKTKNDLLFEDVKYIDNHIRKLSSSYTLDDVDFIIYMKDINKYLNSIGIGNTRFANKVKDKYIPSENEVELLIELYKEDYALYYNAVRQGKLKTNFINLYSITSTIL